MDDFEDAKPEAAKPGLAQMTMDAVTSGRVKFFPERYARSYLDWLAEKRDWCISRQLWWGHRIPVWRIRIDVNPQNAGREIINRGIDHALLGEIPGAVAIITRAETGEVVNPELSVGPKIEES